MATITGTSGNDSLVGTAGDDTLDGLAGNDTLRGNAGNDLLDGGAGTDLLDGGIGDDRYIVTAGDTLVDAGGIDTVIADASRALAGGFENITYTGTANTSSAGNSLGNVMTGNAGNNRLEGRDGNDTLIGGAGRDTLIGGNGNDSIAGGIGPDVLQGGAGQDTFSFAEIEGAGSRDSITDFVSGQDKIVLDAAVFTAIGPEGNFTANDPRFYAAAGATQGHDADDRIIVNLFGGGFEVYYDPDGSGPSPSQNLVLINGSTPQATDFAVTGVASPPGVIRGTEGDDSLVGTSGNDSMQALAGNDTLDAGTGTDSLDGGLGNDTYVLDADGFDVFVDAGGVDTIILENAISGSLPDGFENLTVRGSVNIGESGISGNSAANVVRNETANDIVFIDGQGGNDTLIGGANMDWFGFDDFFGPSGHDVIDGGAGFDMLDLFDSGPLTVDFRAGTVTGDGTASVVFSSVEWAVTGGFADVLFANDAGVRMGGGGGNDTLVGGEGNDELMGEDGFRDHDTGETGDDQILGNGGNDTLIGGRGNDTMNGGTGSDEIRPFDGMESDSGPASYGQDSIDGGAGTDTLFLRTETAVVLDLAAGTLAGGGGAGGSASVVNVENFSILEFFSDGAFDDSLAGDGANNRLESSRGNDTLNGRGGVDTLAGGDGADNFVFSVAPGAANADVITDFASADTIVLDRDAHNNVGPDGNFSVGDDRFFAGAGANSGQDASDRVVYNTTTGQLWYDADGNAPGLAQLIATLAGAPALAATDIAVGDGSGGGGGAQHIVGTAGNDNLVGGAGNDTLEGLAGDDTLNGAGGADSLVGGTGADRFVFSDPAEGSRISDFEARVDKIVIDGNEFTSIGSSGDFAAADGRFFAASGATSGQDASDRVIWNTSTGDIWYDADGNGAGASRLITNVGTAVVIASDFTVINATSAGFTLNGTGGNDTLTGTSGNDTMNGLDGADMFMTNGGSDVVTGGAGSDTITFNGNFAATGIVVNYATSSITGGEPDGGGSVQFSSVERVIGSLFNDSMSGTAGSQNLTGAGADDTLWGGTGVDTLWGGNGVDTFVFREMGSGNADRISDFGVGGAETIALDDSAFTAIGAPGDFAAGDGRFRSGAGITTGQDANDRVIYNTTNGNLYYDPDGSGAGAAQLVATLTGAPALAATDITVI